MLIVAGIGGEVVRRPRVLVTGLLPHVFVCLHLGEEFLALLAETLTPVDRLAATQPVDDVAGQRVGTSLGLRLVKTATPMPKSGTRVIRAPQPTKPPPCQTSRSPR